MINFELVITTDNPNFKIKKKKDINKNTKQINFYILIVISK